VLVASIAHLRTFTIKQMKEYLAGRGIPVRPAGAPRAVPPIWKMPMDEPRIKTPPVNDG
jgi:hypothetical protein